MVNEYARQGFHLLSSLGLAVLAWVLAQHWFLLLCATLIALGALLIYLRPSFIVHTLTVFDRREALFAGEGAFMAVLGGFLVVLLFPAQAVPALIVLAVADAAATVAGVFFGRRKVFWSASKTWVGVATFFVCSCAILVFFSSWWLVVALLATVVEAADYSSYPLLDDNVLIPLTVAAALVVF